MLFPEKHISCKNPLCWILSSIEQGMDQLMQGRTVFIIAHRLSTVRNADQILVLEHGQIIEQGNHQSLLAQKGKYYQLYHGMFLCDTPQVNVG